MTPEQQKIMYIALIILVLIAAGVGVWYFYGRKTHETFSFEFF